jgi:hypothetical protein
VRFREGRYREVDGPKIQIATGEQAAILSTLDNKDILSVHRMFYNIARRLKMQIDQQYSVA